MSNPNVPMGSTCFQKRIDDEVLRLEKVISDSEKRTIQLKVERNAHAAISRLPHSVMSEIFTILASTRAPASWYKINLVCQHWRDVALGTVALWTTPPTHHPDLTLLMLERSKMADISVNLTSKTSHATSTSLLRQVGRIQSLSVANNFAELRHAMRKVKRSKACARLRLKKLHVEHLYCQIPFDDPSMQALNLPIFDQDVLPIPSLTHLCLDIEDMFSCPKIPLRRLLSILQEMKNLECLKLIGDLISQDASLGQLGFHDVHLPHLHSLDISWVAPQQHITSFLSHLRLPRLDSLVIECHSDPSSQPVVVGNSSCLMRAVWSTIGRGDFKISQKLLVSGLDWCAFRPLCDIPNRSSEIDVGMVVRLDIDGLNPLAADVMTTLEDSTILSRIIELEIEDMDEVTDFVGLFGRLLDVESIRVPWECVPSLTNALTIISNGSPQVFPKLRRIVVTPCSDYAHNLQGLYDCFMARQQAGAPIRELYLKFMEHVGEEGRSILRSLRTAGVEVVQVETFPRWIEVLR